MSSHPGRALGLRTRCDNSSSVFHACAGKVPVNPALFVGASILDDQVPAWATGFGTVAESRAPAYAILLGLLGDA